MSATVCCRKRYALCIHHCDDAKLIYFFKTTKKMLDEISKNLLLGIILS